MIRDIDKNWFSYEFKENKHANTLKEFMVENVIFQKTHLEGHLKDYISENWTFYIICISVTKKQ